jgi:hypothetical protein
MRPAALISLLVAAASAAAIDKQAYPAAGPTDGALYGVPFGGNAYSQWGIVSAGSGSKSYTYTIGSGDIGSNFYFRTTVYGCDTQGSPKFKTTITGNDGTGHLGSGDFTIKGDPVAFSAFAVQPVDGDGNVWYFPDVGGMNTTQLIAASADKVAKAKDQVFTFTVALAETSGKCEFYSDLITYGTTLGSSAVGKDGNPGKVQDAWIPCCDATTSAYQLVMTPSEHHYLEVAATTDKGTFDSLKLTNPNSLFGVVVDTTSFPSSTHTGSETARTCLTNSSCSIIADNYYVELVTYAYAYDAAAAKDFHATFTLTTKAGVATASATIAMAVAALFALFH